MLRQLNLADKEKMLSLISDSGMFAEEEVSYMAETFEATQDSALWFGAFNQEEQMTGVAYCVEMEMTNATWNVLMLCVHPEYHRQGIGKALMVLMEQTLQQQSQRLLIVETSSTDDFATARQFYSAIGYEQQGTIKHYYDQNDHKETFIKLL